MRYTGPTHRVSRRLGISILESGKEFTKGKQRRTPPGMHVTTKRNMKNYGLQLVEKQKVRFIYGLTDKQLKNTYKRALNMKGSSSQNLINLIESRLDNLVYRMGFAPTRKGARQLVNHGHILVNGKKCNIPSAIVSVNSIITLSKIACEFISVQNSLKNQTATLPFVNVEKSKCEGIYVRYPERSELNKDFNESLIIEFYNR